jgi:hypothetical protein
MFSRTAPHNHGEKSVHTRTAAIAHARQGPHPAFGPDCVRRQIWQRGANNLKNWVPGQKLMGLLFTLFGLE